jgi:hypothetical protein
LKFFWDQPRNAALIFLLDQPRNGVLVFLNFWVSRACQRRFNFFWGQPRNGALIFFWISRATAL